MSGDVDAATFSLAGALDLAIDALVHVSANKVSGTRGEHATSQRPGNPIAAAPQSCTPR